MDYGGIRKLKGLCPVGGETVERVKIATAGFAVERYRCVEHGIMTYSHGATRDVRGPEPMAMAPGSVGRSIQVAH